MSDVLEVIGDVLLVLGAIVALIAAVGVHKLRDPFSRMHAAGTSPTLGLILAAVGAALRIQTGGAAVTLALVVVLYLMTSPVSTHLAARALHMRIDVRQAGRDELAEAEPTFGKRPD